MRALPVAAAALLLGLTGSVFANDFIGAWMITIDAPGIAPYAGRLDIEDHDGELRAWVENGPVPIEIDGDDINVTVSSRDRQGFRFERVLEGTLADGEISGVVHLVGLLETAAENGEEESPWNAVRVESIPARDSDRYTLEDFEGTWAGIRGVDFRKYDMDLTDKGKAWLAEYDARMDEPQKRCVSPGLVATTTWIFPFEIIVDEERNRLTMLYEAFAQVRRVFMDQTEMPEFYPESAMGYSQGRFEDGELLVETTLLSASTREFNGEPVSENTRIEERYFLTNDGQRLNMVMTMYDPENYNRPPIRRRAWDKSDDTLIFPFECDPDSFFRQLFNEGRMQEYIDRAYMRP